MSARRHLGLVALLYGYRALAGLLVALPAAAAIGGAVGAYPRGQAELFDAGGLMLLESIRLARHALPAVAWSGGAITVLAAAIGLVPLAALIAGLDAKGRVGAAFLAERAAAHAGTMALLFGVGAATEVVLAAILALAGGKLVGALGLASRAEDLAFLGLSAFVLAAVAIVGVARDLAFVAAVHQNRRFYDASRTALARFARAPFRAVSGWAWRAALGLGALAFAAWAAPPVREASFATIAIAVTIHQLGLLANTFARASWLAAAIRLIDHGAPQRAHAPDGDDAPT